MEQTKKNFEGVPDSCTSFMKHHNNTHPLWERGNRLDTDLLGAALTGSFLTIVSNTNIQYQPTIKVLKATYKILY